MANIRIQHIYPCDEETFWRAVFFDADFNRRLFIEHLKFKEWTLVKSDETDDTIKREVRVHPTTAELPAPLAKLVGNNLSFREEGVFDKKKKRHRYKVIPAMMPDKLAIDGEIWCEARGEGKVERFVEMNVKASVFGLGGMIERRILDDTKQSYDKGAAFAVQELNAKRIG
jgi:hypothetical protein